MLATKPNLTEIFDSDMPCDALICKDALSPLDDISSSLPSAVTNLVQKKDDFKTTTIESRTTQIQEREDDEDINPKDATTASTRCPASSTSATGLSATALPYFPVGPSYVYSYEPSYVYMPWCCVTNCWPTGYVMYWATTWPIWRTIWPI